MIPGEQTADQRAATYSAANVADPANSLSADQARAANQGKPGYDALGNPIATPSTVSGAAAVPSPYVSRLGPEPVAAPAPETAEQIQQRKEADARKLIDSVNQQYDAELKNQTTVNEGRERGTNAISVLTGLSGSTEANVAADKTNQINANELNKINAQRGVAIQGILGRISDAAVAEARQQRDEARQSAQDVMAYREKAASDAVTHLTQLAQTGSGATLAGLKASLSPEEYDYLVKNAGGEDAASAILFNGRPKDTVLGTPQIFGSQVFQAYKAPDGSVKYESVPLPTGVDPSGIQSIEKTDNGIFIIKKDGTWSNIAGSGSIPKQTQADKQSNVILGYNQIFTPGFKLKDGTPAINDESGRATYSAWRQGITDAPGYGLSRVDFIKNFGYLTVGKDGTIDPEYGLTPVEKKLILGNDNSGGA